VGHVARTYGGRDEIRIYRILVENYLRDLGVSGRIILKRIS
jgi:hypothetical protein